MPKLRYKDLPNAEFHSTSLNVHALNEVLTGDDSAFFKDLDVYLEAKKEWKTLSQAFRDHDIIIDNYNVRFFEPMTEEDRERGYTED